MKRISFADAALAVLVACAVLVTALVVRRELFPPGASPPRVEQIRDWQEFSAAGRRMGTATARVTILEFSDFQCPFCREIQPVLDSLRAAHPGDVAVVYRHFPLDAIHPHARSAAIAAECAGEQDRFEAYHDALFAEQALIGTKPWQEFASPLPDTAAFTRCMREVRPAERLAQDARAAARLRVESTPTFLVNDRKLRGPTADVLASTVDELLEESR